MIYAVTRYHPLLRGHRQHAGLSLCGMGGARTRRDVSVQRAACDTHDVVPSSRERWSPAPAPDSPQTRASASDYPNHWSGLCSVPLTATAPQDNARRETARTASAPRSLLP